MQPRPPRRPAWAALRLFIALTSLVSSKSGMRFCRQVGEVSGCGVGRCTHVVVCAAGVYTVDDPTIVKLDREVRAAMQRSGLS